jgi:two-component system, sporulation sensor kinase D
VKIKQNKGILYILFVIIPTIFITSTLYVVSRQYLYMENEKKATKIAAIYKQNLDDLMKNTITSLEVLSLVAATTNNDAEKIQQVLNKLPKSTKDFSEYYYAHPEGYIYLASHEEEFAAPVPVGDREYFKEALAKKGTSFSKFVEDRVKNEESIIAAHRVEGEDKQTVGVLIAILHLKNMEKEIIDPMYPFFTLHDEVGTEIIGNVPPNKKDFYKESEKLEDIPWSVTIYTEKITVEQIIQRCIPISLFTLFFTHVLYLFILYRKLKKETALEKEQNDMQKLELVGSLAASTAHEIRNPLTGIKGFVTLLSQKYDNEEDRLYFSIIQDEISRINEIISDFLVLGKPVEFDKQTHNLTDIVEEVLPIIDLEAKMSGIHVEHTFTAQQAPIHCSKNHIKQILLNLSKNAIEAMDEHDTLTIQVHIQENCAHLLVKDTGEGIPYNIMDQIFQPFFTSKDTGTGLGLVICERIVDTYNGKMMINSVPGKGTSVEVVFPLRTP